MKGPTDELDLDQVAMNATEVITRDDPADARVRRECRLWCSAMIRKERTMSMLLRPMVCPKCQEPLREPHDESRCKTIAQAFALENANMGDEISYQIMVLVYWLRDHPSRPSSARRQSARSARQQLLDKYVEIAQK